jgi:hypothetical protein
MKKSNFRSTMSAALVVSSLFASGAARAEDPAKYGRGPSLELHQNVKLGLGIGGSGDASSDAHYEFNVIARKPEDVSKSLWTGQPLEESGKIKSGGFHYGGGNGRNSLPNQSSDMDTSFKMGAEYTWGEYEKSYGTESSKSTVIQAEINRDAIQGETSGKVRIGRQKTQGRDFAPVGSNTTMPIQMGLSQRYGLYVETGASQQDPKNGTHFLVNAVIEEQIQYCKSFDQAERNALCMNLLMNLVLGSEVGSKVSGRAIYAHKAASGKGYLYAGTEGSIGSMKSAGGEVGGAQLLGVVGVAAQ